MKIITSLKILFSLALIFSLNKNSFSSLSGTYTIGAGGDYATINSAVSSLITGGVSGPVVFEIKPGTYDEVVTIDSIPGTSSVNTVTFKSQTNNANDVIWRHTSQPLGNRLLGINGADYITFTKIYFFSPDFSTVNLFEIWGICDNLRFIRNKFSFSIFDMYGGQYNNLLFEENDFYGFTHAIEIFSGPVTSGCNIINNVFNGGSDLHWLTLDNFDSPAIERNIITGGGINLLHCYNEIRVLKNKTGNTMHFGLCTGVNSLIANNFVFTNVYGISVEFCSGLQFYFNSANLFHWEYIGPTATLFIRNCNNITFKNNLLSNRIPGYTYVSDNSSSILSDHNNFITTGSPIAKINGLDYSNVNDLSSATGNDNNSMTREVFFNSNNDLHLTGMSIGDTNIRGIPIQGISEDIDNQLRNPVRPYIGADEADFPLPVEITSFSSFINQRDVTLNWTTATEENNSGFEIERSIVNGEWSMVNFVAGKGNSNTSHNYSYEDKNLSSGKYKYRLKQIDFNGNLRYYELQNEVVIGIPDKFYLYQNYPNPFNPATVISYQLAVSSDISLKVYDINGKEIMTLVNEKKDAGYYKIEFNGANLASGVYFYKIEARNRQAGDFVFTRKMLILK